MKTIETHLKTNIKDFVVSRETYISSILVLNQFTRNVFRNSAKAYQGDEKAKQLCKNGYYVGISAAANCLAAEQYIKMNPNDVIVTFLCDRGDRYMSMFNKN